MSRAFPLTILAVAAVSITTVNAQSDSPLSKASALHQRLDRLQLSHSPSEQISLYADDVVISSPEHTLVKGKKSALALLQSQSRPLRVIAFHSSVEQAWSSGDMLFDTGTAEMRVESSSHGVLRDPVAYFIVWQRDASGDYKVKRVIWNLSAPAPQDLITAR